MNFDIVYEDCILDFFFFSYKNDLEKHKEKNSVECFHIG